MQLAKTLAQSIKKIKLTRKQQEAARQIIADITQALLAEQRLPAEMGFKLRYCLDPERPIKPKDMNRIVTESSYLCQLDIKESQELLNDLQDAKILKQWLTETCRKMEADAILEQFAQEMFLGKVFI